MPSSVQWCLLYLLLVLLIVLSYYLTKMFLSIRKKIIGKPTYPIVKAFSILLIAFALQNGLSQVLFPVLMDMLGYKDYVYTSNPHESIVFYIVVGAVAIAYTFSLRTEKRAESGENIALREKKDEESTVNKKEEYSTK